MIINLTQHMATAEQIAVGVVDIAGEQRQALIVALTFDVLPTLDEINERADFIAHLAVFNGLYDLGDGENSPYPTAALIGGAPWLMGALETALKAVSVQPLYAFSVRESVEQTQDDGSVKKVNIFRHAGFVTP